jgi:molybdate transport system regulatory protein
MNACFREPLVTSIRGGRKGGGMKVSEAGLRVIALYQKIEQAALEASAPSWEELNELLAFQGSGPKLIL